jgi:predicted transcriptional regulator
VAEKDYFLGMLARETLGCAVVDGRKEQPLKDLVETLHVPHLHTDHALHLALERMSKYHLDVLPVVHRADIHKLEGVVTLQDVLNEYGVDCISGLSDSSH